VDPVQQEEHAFDGRVVCLRLEVKDEAVQRLLGKRPHRQARREHQRVVSAS
jgi:hypothetical protein